MHVQFNLPNNTHSRSHVYSNFQSSKNTTSYIDLRPNINKKPNLYDAVKRKNSYPYHKFQTGSTTTFSGYTNISNFSTKRLISSNKNNNNDNNLSRKNNNKQDYRSHDHFQKPSRRNYRTIEQAERYRNQVQIYQHATTNINENNKITSMSTVQYKGLILSDSMCKYVRSKQVSTNKIQVRISFESGCNCNRMLNFLERQQNMMNNDLNDTDFVVFSLCTNDVGYLGADKAIEHCRYLIQRTRELFPRLKAIGWLALSPRWKPSKFFSNPLDINQNNQKFNQSLYMLSKEINIEIINANLQHQHMHDDGLHPSITFGRDLIERAIHKWFIKQESKTDNINMNKYKNLPININNDIQQRQYINNKSNKNHNNNKNYYNKNNYNIIKSINNDNEHNMIKHHENIINNNKSNVLNQNYHHYNNDKLFKSKYNHNNNNNTNIKNNFNDRNNNNTYNNRKKHSNKEDLINYYPHFLRHKAEFQRKIHLPKELEGKIDEIFCLSNLHYQAEYLKLEAEKWKTYVTATIKKGKTVVQEQMETIIIEEDNNNNNSIPIARPSPHGHIEPPAPLDFTELDEFFDEWVPDPIPGQKRKLVHRRDDPPTPPSPRHPPPVIPRRILPPRDQNIPIKGGSLQTTPLGSDQHEGENRNKKWQRCSFNALLPINDKQERKKDEQQQNDILIVETEKEPTMIISPIRSSTPEQIMKSPSVIPKNHTTVDQPISFDFPIIPIECKFYFKNKRQPCTYQTIQDHYNILDKECKKKETERDDKLRSMFPKEAWSQVVAFVKKAIETTIEKKKKENQKRLDNLLLDQKREQAARTIQKSATKLQQHEIEQLNQRYIRTLNLKLQLDKLEIRFMENMPPPYLNTLDKIQLYAKELEPDNNHLSSLREQWRNILRKTKLDLTTLMRQAKIAELEKANKEYQELIKNIPSHLYEAYDTLCHIAKIRHQQYAKRKLNFLAKRAKISFPPQANNKALILRDAEVKLLNLGPKFVPPAPEQVLERLPNEIENMKNKISRAWRNKTNTIKKDPPIVTDFCKRIEEKIRETVEKETTVDRALAPTMKFLNKIQKEKKIIFRKTDKSKVFHIDTAENYVTKSATYMAKTNAYTEISDNPLKEMIEKTDSMLRKLLAEKKMPQYLYEKLRPSRTEARLPYLYYNPKDHKLGEPLRPIVNGIKSPLEKISSFLDKSIRPLFDKHTTYALQNSIIFLQHLKDIQTTSETKIYTFDITDLYTMVPQKEAVLAVCEFLGRNGYIKIKGLSINTIKTLFTHVLENAYFILELPGKSAKYYRQIKGGPMGLACTQVLADIYVKQWEREFVEQQKREKQLYFRFRDDIFFTTILKNEHLEARLSELNKKDPNIQITWEGGNIVNYLDVTIKVEVPIFRTTVYRKLAAQPYVLPFHSAHPKHITRNIPYAAALRATRICSHPDDLQDELNNIRIMLLLNKYPPRFIDKQVARFYKELTGEETLNTLIGGKHGEFRERVLKLDWNKKDKRKIDFNNDVLVHFSYTPSLARFGQCFHQIWQEVFQGTPLDNIPVKYANRLTSSLQQLLVKKRPTVDRMQKTN